MEGKSVITGRTTTNLLFPVRSVKRKMARFKVLSSQTAPTNRASEGKIKLQSKRNRSEYGKGNFHNSTSLEQKLSKNKMHHLADELSNSTLSATMIYFAENGHFLQAQSIWEEMLSNNSPELSVQTVSKLFSAYGKFRHFNEVKKILDQLSYSNFSSLREAYSLALSCFGNGGQLQLMENTLKEMTSRGFPVDSATRNEFIKYSSIHGSLTEMETAYCSLKGSRHLINKEGIKAMSFAYLRGRKFYRLSEFLRDVGLGRKDVGNLLWNFLLLSYAANFKMKTLQREFLNMSEAGFCPDLTTFNIRALAFSRMSLLWDLHLSLEHMNHLNVSPDLVTCGCFVDAYLDRRLGRNLEFSLSKMDLDQSPVVLTDPCVFEVLGKGDFHLSAESFLEFKRKKKWTYRELVSIYLKKQYRSNQIFWNY